MQIPIYIAAIGVAGTWFVALIALFGQAFWGWIRRPRLRVALLGLEGDLETEILRWQDDPTAPIQERSRDARYYRLRVENLRQASVVQDVQIVVDAIERVQPNGQPALEYRGPVPLAWQHPEAFPKFRSVGTAAVADFVIVSAEGTLRLATVITPNKYKAEYAGGTQLWVTVAARGRESDSSSVRFLISWDGTWERGSAEKRTHFNIDQEKVNGD